MNTLRTAIKDFLLHCRFEKNLSPKTLRAYETDLIQLETFLINSSHPLEITSINKHQLREFLVFISALKPKSIKRKVAAIKAMFNHLEFEDKILINPLRKMRIKLKEPYRLPSVLDIQEITKIFRTVYKREAHLLKKDTYGYMESVRDIVVIELLFSTGARVSEIANLKKECVNLTSGSITIRGKGNKERIIYICNKETITMLRNYYFLFEKKIELSGKWFLVNRFNKKLSDQSIRILVKKIAIQAGLTKRITPHIFRHSFATLLLENDVDIKYIQAFLGHSSILTTQIYTHVNRVKQKKILTVKHPRKGFSMHMSMNNQKSEYASQ